MPAGAPTGLPGAKYDPGPPTPRELPLLLKSPSPLDLGTLSTFSLQSVSGRILAIFLADGLGGAPIPGIPEPVPITGGSVFALVSVLLMDGSGRGSVAVSVPPDTALTGVPVFFQAFGLGPSHVLVSNPVGDTIR